MDKCNNAEITKFCQGHLCFSVLRSARGHTLGELGSCNSCAECVTNKLNLEHLKCEAAELQQFCESGCPVSSSSPIIKELPYLGLSEDPQEAMIG